MLERNLRRSLSRSAIRSGMASLGEALATCWAIADNQGQFLEGDIAALSASACEPSGYPQLRVHAPIHGAALAAALSSLLVIEQERKAMADEALARYRELNLLFRIHEQIGMRTLRADILQSIVGEASRLAPGSRAVLLLATEDGAELQLAAGDETSHQARLRSGQGIAGSCFGRWRADVLNDVAGSPDYAGETRFRSVMVAPMGEIEHRLGVLLLGSDQPDTFDANQLKLFATLAAHGAIVLENVRLYDELRTALRRAEAANQAKGSFLRNMGHELRTPLNIIIGHGQLLESVSKDEMAGECVAHILSTSRHLLEMVNDILEVARRDDEESSELRNFSLSEFALACMLPWQRSATAKGLRLEQEIDPALPQVLAGDERRILQALRHLFSNAIKFSEKGRILFRAEAIECRGKTIKARFMVQDEGIGIPPEQHARIFSCFAQGEEDIGRRFGGTGLGLAVCKYLVERMGGQLGMESHPGEGSCFWFDVWLSGVDA